YNGVTPFATGGQPFQIYSFTKRGTSASVATSAVLANFVTFMIATNLIAFVSLFFYPQITQGLAALNMEWAKYVAIVGYTINFLVLLFMIALGTSKHLKNGIIAIIKFLTKPKFLNKHFAKLIPSFEAYCENAQIGFRSIWVHKKTFIFSLLIKIVTMLAYYLIPYFLIKAVGLNITLGDNEFVNLMIVLFSTSFAITAVVWVPTPGGTGGIEYAFSIVISSVCLMTTASGAALALSLLWRLVTYYFTLLISFAFVCVFQARDKKALSQLEETPKETTNV
ncbi:MAG: flippase-like domain-containing protein, partial [Bacilli bacterium]|nr:flippase-like domain-containing protein [Bacilli bacterium]